MAVTNNVRLNFSEFVPNLCKSETVYFEGTIHIVTSLTLDKAEGIFINFLTNVNATGIGLVSGTEYLVSETIASLNEDAKPPFPFVTNFNLEQEIITNGSPSNQIFKQILHVTINANGEVAADISNFDIVCRD